MELPPLADLFAFGVAPAELVLRGTAVYWFLFLLFRFVLRRDAGALGIADLLLLVLIADAAQNAMSGGYETLSEGAVLVATIMGWAWGMDWAAFHFEPVRRFAQAGAIVLVRDGRMQRRAMRREYLSEEELMEGLRKQGIERLDQVKTARMESDGSITAIRRDDDP